ncbi:ComEA family DNA-binding protein [Spiribacter vilamensis]|uniref:Competence protein ComEA n=1 Tax=Spiribacter vilamensis TaxID=531306 RepID=A0A4Q8D0F5_9GAMM|nr:helix-hairpin-helix domain-containing protein [Spiribacter vilamensis]RZU98811.1 competence protein ComEA [Spiribacter vilamensis]TVO62169.1 helix-hairpin-helix domain-containing protein [Spiribacter vilamensis]
MTFTRQLGTLLATSLVAGAAVASEAPINVNEASVDRLQQINGIGPATARAIIEDRERNGPFERIDAMTRVDGIGEVTLDGMRETIAIE